MNILAIPALAVSIFSLVVCYNNTRDIMYPGVMFNGIWSFAILMNQINLNGFYDVHENTYAIILLGVVCFNIPFLTSAGSYEKENSMSVDGLSIKSVHIIMFIQIVLTLLLVRLAIKAVPFYAMYGTSGFRTIVAKSIEYGYMTSVERILYIHNGVFPLSLITNGLMFLLWMNGIAKTRHLALGIVNELLISYCSGSRGNILIILIFMVEAMLLTPNTLGIVGEYYNKIKKQVKWIAIVLVIVLVALSVRRGNVGEGNFILEFLKTISGNFSGGIQLFDQAVNDPTNWDLDHLRFGYATIYGFLSVIFLVIRMVTLGRVNISLPSVTETASSFFYVSETQTMNAYVTCFYTFMQDFGIIGVIIWPIIIGIVSVKIYQNVRSNPNLFNSMTLMMMEIVLLFSTIRWRLMLSDWGSMFAHTFWLCLLLLGSYFPSRIRFKIHK